MPPGANSEDGAFSLLELLVVIALIAILAGIVIASAGAIQKSVKNRTTRLWIVTLEAGIADYRQDHGIVPLNPADGQALPRSDELARQGAALLYARLSGDTDQAPDGRVDDPEQVYVDRLAHEFQKNAETILSARSGDDFLVIDPRGTPMRYLASPPNLEPDRKITRNPEYDLWSLGGGTPDDPARWITNWAE